MNSPWTTWMRLILTLPFLCPSSPSWSTATRSGRKNGTAWSSWLPLSPGSLLAMCKMCVCVCMCVLINVHLCVRWSICLSFYWEQYRGWRLLYFIAVKMYWYFSVGYRRHVMSLTSILPLQMSLSFYYLSLNYTHTHTHTSIYISSSSSSSSSSYVSVTLSQFPSENQPMAWTHSHPLTIMTSPWTALTTPSTTSRKSSTRVLRNSTYSFWPTSSKDPSSSLLTPFSGIPVGKL